MEVKEVVLPTSVVDHMSMSSTCSTPYMSAASSPQRPRPRPRHLDFFYYSAPTSPRSSSSYLYDDHSSFDDDVVGSVDVAGDKVPLLGGQGLPSSSSVAVPFDWELKPGVAKTAATACSSNDQESGKEQVKDEFEFDFSGQLDKMVRPSLSSADELFDGGKIRPMKLKPPPRLHISSSPDSSRIRSGSPSPKSKFKDALNNVSVSPRHRRRGSDYQDPFEAALCNTTKDDDSESRDRGRGRGRAKPNIPTSPNKNSDVNASRRGGNSGRKGISRSLSPLRVSEFALLHEQYLQDQQNQNETISNNNSSRAVLGSNYSRKWKLKDLFLFRSASEGHYKDSQSFSKRWSFRSSTTAGSGSGSVSESGSVSKRRGGQASAHEMHYTTNKAVSEEMKKKTTLPYKHGLLACLGFSPLLPQFSYNFPSSPSSPLSY